MSTIPIPDDRNEVASHAWWPQNDYVLQAHLWRCTCKELVVQPFGTPVPDELISHPQSFGQLRGERS